jgi:hypothetical protein
MKTEDKVIIIGAVIALSMLLNSGCNTGMVSSRVTTTTETIATNGTPVTVTQENRVTLTRGTLLVNSEVDKANVKWGDVTVSVGGYSTTGDADSINALGNAITSGIMAYFTYGTAPAVKGAVMASLLPTQPSASTNAPAVK